MLLLWIAAAAQAGCGGSIAALQRSWSALAVPVPTTTEHLGPSASVLAEHSAVEEALRKARPRSGRSGLPAALAAAEGWLSANDQAVGVAEVRDRIAAVRSSCPAL